MLTLQRMPPKPGPAIRARDARLCPRPLTTPSDSSSTLLLIMIIILQKALKKMRLEVKLSGEQVR